MNVMKITAKSNPNLAAGAITAAVREGGHAELQAQGAGAVNQAMKAIATANTFLAPADLQLCCQPCLTETEEDGATRTTVRLLIKAIPLDPPFFPVY